MSYWTEERVKDLRKLWGLGLTGQEIADRLGGIEKRKDGGSGAVYYKVKLLREAAAAAKNKEEEDFWTRDATHNSAAEKRQKFRRNRRSIQKEPASKEAQETIASVNVGKIPWPTDEQVNAETARLITAAAKAEV